MAVTRCVCFRKTFREVLAIARERNLTTVAQIARETGCGAGCGGCRYYLQAVLDTGVTCYAVRLDDGPPKPCTPEPWDIH
jgi:bacterioferritin-associated ferredoxin